MTEVENKINKLIGGIKKEFKEKKKKILLQLEEIENRKKEEYTLIKGKMSVLGSKKKKLKEIMKNYNKKLRIINKNLNHLIKERINDEKKLKEIERIKKEYPLTLKNLASFGKEKQGLDDDRRKIQTLISRLEKKIEDEKRKASKLKQILGMIDQSEEEIKGTKISKDIEIIIKMPKKKKLKKP
jgi:chromosome segregation ATPase